VPVVFHIISNNPSSITDQQIQAALQDLNDAFAHSGNYSSGRGANTRIRFCLARIDPDGGITSGITRTQSVLGDFDGDIENDRMKKLVSWNTRAYCNIWLVDGIKNEYFTNFSCGVWSRRHDTGNGSFSPDGDYRDGIVTKEFGSVLAMLMGQYLGLNYTFVLRSCENNNCDTDGDGICDTPPASAPGNSCTGYQNSCSSDTLSGFTKDMPDLDSNFMSFSGPCTNSFTEGQASKMRTMLAGARNSLFTQNKCDPPCTENISVSFTRNNWFPAAGDLIQFSSLSTGGTNYQWSVNGLPAGTNNPGFSQSFTQPGKYKVMLKVFNTNQACYASYSDSVIVGCGVMARFYPDKRIIASKDQILNDSILFSNRSVNAGSYQWWISNNSGMLPQIISTGSNLNQIFHSPGEYSLWLIASNGGCSDTTEKFNVNVLDPTVDATMSFPNLACYEQTKIKVDMRICNQGYVQMPAGTPITFYDGDPRSGKAKKLDPVYLLPSPIEGNCCSGFSTILEIGTTGLNRLYAVINDNGNTNPLVLPNTSLPENTFTNNMAYDSNFQFKVSISPPSATLEPGDTLQLAALASPGSVSSYLWINGMGLNCTDCPNPVFIAGKDDITKKVIATSQYGCLDSSSISIKVPFADDFVITIDSMSCAKDNSVFTSFTIYNQFKLGILPDGLKISFYEGNPSTDTARLILPVYTLKTDNQEKKISVTNFFEGIKPGDIYAIVNDSGEPAPVQLQGDNLFPEKDYTNNSSHFLFLPFTVSVYPSDTTVSRGKEVPLHVEVSGGQPVNFNWNPAESVSCAYCPEPVVTPSHSQLYELEILNKYACKASAYTQINTITGGRVNIPNAFTPNGDGRNDIFYIMGSQDIKMVRSFSIFSRWGQAVFSETNIPPNDPKFGWNGLNNGRPFTSESYIYVAVIEFTDGSQQVYKGSVVLIK
jgi:gliding motility-associated-like protein